MTSPRRRWLYPLLGVLVIFAIAGAAMSFVFFVVWTDIHDALPDEALKIFDAALLEAGGGTPYIEITDHGTVVVHREQEGNEFDDFRSLRLLIWVPDEEKVLSVAYPRWFVRLKTWSSLNLGTMIAAASRDWGQLDLSVSFDDLRRRGPALLLDNQLDNGARILLWTSAD